MLSCPDQKTVEKRVTVARLLLAAITGILLRLAQCEAICRLRLRTVKQGQLDDYLGLGTTWLARGRRDFRLLLTIGVGEKVVL